MSEPLNYYPLVLKREDESVIELKAPYLLSYDTQAFRVQDFHQFDKTPPLVVVKSLFIDTVEAYAQSYTDSVLRILYASEACAKRERKGSPILDKNGAMGLASRVNVRLESFYERIVQWDGKSEISILLPYSVINTEPSDIIGGPAIVDMANTAPYINGILFSAQHV